MIKKPIITTKKGDRGESFLFSGEKVPKSHPRLEAYGDIDELISLLGVVRCQLDDESLKAEILKLQRALFVVASELATSHDSLEKLPQRIDAAFLKSYEETVRDQYKKTNIPPDFIVPGSNPASSYLDLARTVARRCERKVARLSEQKEINNPSLLIWINRLSDHLYLLARFVEEKPLLVKERQKVHR